MATKFAYAFTAENFEKLRFGLSDLADRYPGDQAIQDLWRFVCYNFVAVPEYDLDNRAICRFLLGMPEREVA